MRHMCNITPQTTTTTVFFREYLILVSYFEFSTNELIIDSVCYKLIAFLLKRILLCETFTDKYIPAVISKYGSILLV